MRLQYLCPVQRGLCPPFVSLRRGSRAATSFPPQSAFSREPSRGDQTSDRAERVCIRARFVPLSLSSSRAGGQRLTVALSGANELPANAIQAPGTILTERREYDCSATNLSWTPSAAARWRSVSTSSRSLASNVRSPILAIGSCGGSTRSGNASVTVRGFASLRLALPPKRQPPRHLEPVSRAFVGGRWKCSRTDVGSRC